MLLVESLSALSVEEISEGDLSIFLVTVEPGDCEDLRKLADRVGGSPLFIFPRETMNEIAVGQEEKALLEQDNERLREYAETCKYTVDSQAEELVWRKKAIVWSAVGGGAVGVILTVLVELIWR